MSCLISSLSLIFMGVGLFTFNFNLLILGIIMALVIVPICCICGGNRYSNSNQYKSSISCSNMNYPSNDDTHGTESVVAGVALGSVASMAIHNHMQKETNDLLEYIHKNTHKEDEDKK